MKTNGETPNAGYLALFSRNIQSVEQDGSYVQNYTSAKETLSDMDTKNDSSGKISCGFKPDLVLKQVEIMESITMYMIV